MKVLWFSNSPGNASNHLRDNFVGSSWISALEKQLQGKVELHLAFYYPKKSDPFRYGETTYHPIGKKNWKFNVLKDIVRNRIIDDQDLNRYLQIINSVKPDIIHIHGTENPFGCIIPYIKIPVLVSLQGYLTVIDKKFQNNFTIRNLKAGNSTLHDGLKEIVLRKSFMRIGKTLGKKKEIEQRNLLKTRYIIGRTDWDRRVASVLAPKSTYFHCDEIIRDEFFRKKWNYIGKPNLVIHSTIGNTPYKGFETICEALIELKRVLDTQIEWQVAGINQNDSIVKATKNKLKAKYPYDEIKYLGRIDEHELVKMMCRADIYVSPSHIENSSNSLCEAMILGMPCVATYAGGTGSLLKDGVEGILIQDGDPWSMAGAVLELHSNFNLAAKYGKKARERAFIRHDPKRIVNELIYFYSEIVKVSKEDET